MTETVSQKPGYTERQKAIIEREVEPETREESDYLEKHGQDVLPKKVPVHPAQRLSNGKKLPDIEISDDWSDH